MTGQGTRRIGVLLGKEIEDLVGSPGLFVPAAITGLIAIMLPFVVAIAIPALTGESLANSSDFRVALEMYRNQPATRGLDAEGAIQAYLFQRFLILLVLAPVASAMAVAAHAVVGEKQARTLEPLLATPLTTFELLAAKVLGAMLPGLALVAIFFSLYLGGVVVAAAPGVYWTLLAPRALLTVFLFSPLASLAALQLTVCVSARVNDVRSAQQIGALIIMPISALMVAEFAGLVDLRAGAVIALSGGLALLNVVLMGVAIRLFDRESILTRWK